MKTLCVALVLCAATLVYAQTPVDPSAATQTSTSIGKTPGQNANTASTPNNSQNMQKNPMPNNVNQNGNMMNTANQNGNMMNLPAQNGNMMNSQAQHGNMMNNQAQNGNMMNNKAQHGNMMMNKQAQYGNMMNNKAQNRNMMMNNQAQNGNMMNNQAQTGNMMNTPNQNGNMMNLLTQNGNMMNNQAQNRNMMNTPNQNGNMMNNHAQNVNMMNTPNQNENMMNIPAQNGNMMNNQAQNGNFNPMQNFQNFLNNGRNRGALLNFRNRMVNRMAPSYNNAHGSNVGQKNIQTGNPSAMAPLLLTTDRGTKIAAMKYLMKNPAMMNLAMMNGGFSDNMMRMMALLGVAQPQNQGNPTQSQGPNMSLMAMMAMGYNEFNNLFPFLFNNPAPSTNGAPASPNIAAAQGGTGNNSPLQDLPLWLLSGQIF